MEVHPWTKYELARIRDEERLLRARDHALAAEARRAKVAKSPEGPSNAISWFDRVLRREPARAPAESGVA